MENLILQGGALAVILLSFLTVLGWLLRHFTAALNRIEKGIHACTLSIIHLTKVDFQSAMRPADGSTNDALKSAYEQNIHSLEEIETLLTRLLDSN